MVETMFFYYSSLENSVHVKINKSFTNLYSTFEFSMEIKINGFYFMMESFRNGLPITCYFIALVQEYNNQKVYYSVFNIHKSILPTDIVLRMQQECKTLELQANSSLIVVHAVARI